MKQLKFIRGFTRAFAALTAFFISTVPFVHAASSPKPTIESVEAANKRIVREAFDTLFNEKNFAAAERFWSPDYIQHSAYVDPGRDGLFELVKSPPAGSRYEVGIIAAEGDIVMVQGRFKNIGRPANWIATDIIRMRDGILVEHWDVIQDEVTRAQSKSGRPMFGDSFPP